MKKNNLLSKKALLLISGLIGLNAWSQSPSYNWHAQMGGSLDDKGYCVVTDLSGNVYTSGAFQGTVDFDPGPGTNNLTSNGGDDIFIQKLDANGNLVWVKQIGGSLDEQGRAITVLDAAGALYVTGYFESAADFDPGAGTSTLTPNAGKDIFVLKLDLNGNFTWVKQMSGSGDEEAFSITTDAYGNVLVAGDFSGTVDFDPTAGVYNISSNGASDIFVLKLNFSGGLVWANGFGSTTSDQAFSIETDAVTDIYVTGYFSGTADFDPGAGTTNLVSAGNNDIFILKLAANGTLAWAQSVGGPLFELGSSVYVDNASHVFISGSFASTVDFDSGAGVNNMTAFGASDGFILKLNSNTGAFLWAQQLGGSGAGCNGSSVKTDSNGNIYLCGRFTGTVDFNPGIGTSSQSSFGSNNDIFILKLDALANFSWIQTVGSAGDDQAVSICLDQNGNIFTTGRFSNTIDFDPGTGISNASSNGTIDCFVLKLSQCSPSNGTDVISACGNYTWINGTTYSSSTNSPMYTFIGGAASGCDSIVTLNLTINNSSSGTDVVSACGSYTWIDGLTYTSSTNLPVYTIVGGAFNGCDSVVSLDLTINVVDVTTSTSNATITANNITATYQWLDCDNGFAPVSGATSQSYTATQPGNYAVQLTDNGCIDTSACVNIVLVGLEKQAQQGTISVFPNPSNGKVTLLNTDPNEAVSYRLISLTGQLLQQGSNVSPGATIDLHQSNGVYILEINNSAGNTHLFRLIIE